jgi:S-adenosylmethionine/arginine decarboxylase-like enzyme
MNMSSKTVSEPIGNANRAAWSAFWGRWCGLDLRGCDLARMTDADAIARYIEGLCDLLGFRRFGSPSIVRFGERPEIAGYSFTQLIETSLVSGHLVDNSRCVFIDIFSCATYSTREAEVFTRRYFRAAQAMSHVVDRYAGDAD